MALLKKIENLQKETTKGPKQKKQMFWKISEWNNDLCAYVVKICSLTKEKAMLLESVWTSQGRYARATPHLREINTKEKKRK